jgi:hypothetical protein
MYSRNSKEEKEKKSQKVETMGETLPNLRKGAIT